MVESKLEALLERPCWVIDILPEQVPEDAEGQYFALEKYWLREPQHSSLVEKQFRILLKLNCYLDLEIWEGETNPAPETLAAAIRGGRLNLLCGGALIVTDPDDTYMTVYDPDERLLRLLRPLAISEGLFLWKPPT